MGESDRAQGLDETSAPSGAIGERALHLRSDGTVSLRARSAFEWVGALRARAKSVCCSSGGALPARSIAAHADGFTNGCDAVVTAALLPERRTSQQERERCERREHARRACARAPSASVCSRVMAQRPAFESVRSSSASGFASRARGPRRTRPYFVSDTTGVRVGSCAGQRRDVRERLVQHDERARGRFPICARTREDLFEQHREDVHRRRFVQVREGRQRDRRSFVRARRVPVVDVERRSCALRGERQAREESVERRRTIEMGSPRMGRCRDGVQSITNGDGRSRVGPARLGGSRIPDRC